jgi:glycosyltransferase involved in cell wall biosynthesis
MTSMHVLVLPSWYATADRPYSGTFFRDQTLAAQDAGLRVGLAYVEPRSLRRFRPHLLADSHFQVTEALEGSIPTVRRHAWNPLAQTLPGGMIWARMMSALVDRYARVYGPPDIVHAHGSLWAGHAAMLASRRRGIPFVVTEHGSLFQSGSISPRLLAGAREVFRAAAVTITVSASLRHCLAKCASVRDILVVPNTVDPQFWTLPPRQRVRSPFTYCAVGNLQPVKAFDDLIRSFAARFRGTDDVRLVIGGDGPMRSGLESLVERLGIRGHVQFLGALSREGVRQAMWDANCLVLPSRLETFGVVLIEALATGLPVVSTRCGGPEDIVTPAVGALVEPGDVEGLATALGAIRESARYDPQTLRAQAVRRYGYAAVGAQLREMYQRALGAL